LTPVPRTTIVFLGQCQTTGYPEVPPELTFPQVCRRAVEACRPGARLNVFHEQYYHPAQLHGAVDKALARRPRIVVVEVVGWLAIIGRGSVDLSRLPSGVRTVYDRLRHFRHVSQLIVAGIPYGPQLVYGINSRGTAMALHILGPLIRRHPRPTVAEYEEVVDREIARIADHPGVSAVIQGPGAPNLDLDSPGLAPDAVERYLAVERMARRIAAARKALYVDRWNTVAAGFFLPGSIRPGSEGHTVWGHLLARELMAAGLV
jgi:hypothetical protein